MRRLIVGVSGASGTPLAYRFVKQLVRYGDCEIHLIVTDSARLTASFEAPDKFEEMLSLASYVHDNASMGETIASGTFETLGMAVVPCSMKTVAGIALGYSNNLLLRAADVCLKEQRTLVLVAREAPMSAVHLRNLAILAALPGVSIMPPVLSYYGKPASIEDVEDQLIGKMFARFGLEYPLFSRWEG